MDPQNATPSPKIRKLLALGSISTGLLASGIGMICMAGLKMSFLHSLFAGGGMAGGLLGLIVFVLLSNGRIRG